MFSIKTKLLQNIRIVLRYNSYKKPVASAKYANFFRLFFRVRASTG